MYCFTSRNAVTSYTLSVRAALKRGSSRLRNNTMSYKYNNSPAQTNGVEGDV